jgi:hypothetical protein
MAGERIGDYVRIAGVQYPVTGKRQMTIASMALRDAGRMLAQIDHWNGREWNQTGLVLHPAEPMPAAAQLGARGGKARAARMTPEQRSEASRKAAQAPRPSRRKAGDV